MTNSNNTKIVVVTGSNKGIGFAVVKGLLENKYPGIVYLTYRNASSGKQALDKLNMLGYNLAHHQLDITDKNSIEKFKAHLKSHHNGIDVLINNAGLKYDSKSTVPIYEQLKATLETNYYGTKNVSEAFLDILKPNSQIINISSAAGHVSVISDPSLRSKFSLDITLEQLETILDDLLLASKNDDAVFRNWKNAAYVISKVAVCALTVIHQRQFSNKINQRNIRINSVHPGYVATDMTKHKGIQSPEEGATSTLFLVLNDNHNLRGQFIWYNCNVVDWLSDIMPKDIKCEK